MAFIGVHVRRVGRLDDAKSRRRGGEELGERPRLRARNADRRVGASAAVAQTVSGGLSRSSEPRS